MRHLIIISGPAGVGKTTVAKALLKKYSQLKSSVTYTTRQARQLSTEDKKMCYASKKKFEAMKNRDEFLEWAIVHGDYYGTHKKETLDLLKQHPVLFNIDVQGAEQLAEQFPGQTVTIFLLPESREQMVGHIKKRGEMSEGSFQARLKSAEFELSKKNKFAYQIMNREGRLEDTIKQIARLIEPLLTDSCVLTKN